MSEAELAQPCHLDPRAAELFAAGLTLPDGCVCESARLTIVEPGLADARVRVRVSLHEGMYHQVKRMLAAVGGTVAKLHRETFGPVRPHPQHTPKLTRAPGLLHVRVGARSV